MKPATKQFNDCCDRAEVVTAGRVIGMAMLRACPGYNQSFAVNFQDLNKTSTKYRAKGKYCDAQVGKARDSILDLPFVEVVRKYSAYTYEIIVHPFDWHSQSDAQGAANQVPSGLRLAKRVGTLQSSSDWTKENTVHGDRSEDKNMSKLKQKDFTKVKKGFAPEKRSKPESKKVTKKREAQERYEQQQHYIAIRSLIQKAGFEFSKEVLYKIARYSAKAIARSIEYVQIQSTSRRGVRNKEGYFIDCLERGYWKSLTTKEGAKNYWQDVVNNFRNSAYVLAEKFKSMPDMSEFALDGWDGAGKRIEQIVGYLEEEHYGTELISSAIAEFSCQKRSV